MQARHIGVVCHARSTSNDIIAFAINTPDKSRRKKGKKRRKCSGLRETEGWRVVTTKREKEREREREGERLSCPRFARNYRRATHALKLRHVYRAAAHYILLLQFYPNDRARERASGKIVCKVRARKKERQAAVKPDYGHLFPVPRAGRGRRHPIKTCFRP